MSERSPEVWLVRHGETEWSRDHRHTSHTDLPLTERGVETATGLAEPLSRVHFDRILSSPRVRARHTAQLAGFPHAELDADLVEWDYGDYEGVTTDEIRRRGDPGWTVWSHPSPGGESPDEVTTRLDRVVARLRKAPGRSLLFAHGHSLRALTARWLGLPVTEGRLFRLDTSTVSVLGQERETSVILSWNTTP